MTVGTREALHDRRAVTVRQELHFGGWGNELTGPGQGETQAAGLLIGALFLAANSPKVVVRALKHLITHGAFPAIPLHEEK